jgi:ribosome-associated toxin RatA of RatAB toxin-antitoxin module
MAIEEAARESPLPDLSFERYEEIRRGEILVFEETFEAEDGKDAGRATAYAYFAHPWPTIWAIVTDFAKQREYMPRLTTSRIVKREGDQVWVRFEMEVLWVDLAWVIRYSKDHEARWIHFALDHSYQEVNKIDDTQGSWEFIPVEGGDATVVVYRLFVDTGYAVPDFVMSYLTRRDLPDVVGNLRKRVDSGGSWKKGD